MACCRVSYEDIGGIRHEVQVEADSLYETVACAVQRFRADESWIEIPPGRACEFRVEVQPHAPIIHSVCLSAVENFARNGTAKGPKDILRKERIRTLLGI